MRKIFILILIALFFFLCRCNKCRDIECCTPPRYYSFEIIDRQTRENLFTNGTYNDGQVNITRDYSLIMGDSISIIEIYGIGWQTEIVNCSICISDQIEFNLYVNAERVSENCCSFTKIHDFKIENIDYEINNETGLISILVD